MAVRSGRVHPRERFAHGQGTTSIDRLVIITPSPVKSVLTRLPALRYSRCGDR